MRAIEMWINGEKKFVAGTEDSGVHACLNYAPQGIDLSAFGSVTKGSDSFFLHWGRQMLKVGDEVTLRLIETDEVDAPESEKRQETQAEKDENMRERLRSAHTLLSEADAPVPPLFEQRLGENNFVEAMCVIGNAGESHGMNASFWQQLGRIAHTLQRYDESSHYRQLRKQAPDYSEGASSA